MIQASTTLLPVCVNDKWGYINLHGEIIVPCQFDYASEFSEGLAHIRLRFDYETYENHEYMVVDDNFREIGRLTCSYATHFSDGLMAFKRSEKWGYVDTSVKVLIPPSFDCGRDFLDGLATLEVNEKWGVIDHSGEWTIPPKFKEIHPFQPSERITGFKTDVDQLGRPCEGDRDWGFLNRRGEIVVEPRFSHLCFTSNGLTPAAIWTGKQTNYGFVDEWGDWIVTPRFDACDAVFVNDALGAAVNDRWGVVNREGGWIIEPRFTYAEAFHEGLSKVYVGGKYEGIRLFGGKCGYIDCDGEFVIQPQFDGAWAFKDGVAQVQIVDGDPEDDRDWNSGYIDQTGRYIWEPTR